MNLFHLSEDFDESVKFHVDRHIVKMPTETSQLLIDTILTFLDVKPPLTKSGNYFKKLSKSQHNHPCAIFCRTEFGFNYCLNYLKFLCKEFNYRYNKNHFCENYLEFALRNQPVFQETKIDFPLAMPEYCRTLDPVLSYRLYYNLEKRHLFCWKNRNVPFWII